MSVLTMKQANKSITLISAAGAKLDERIHTVGVAGIAHFLQHGDTTLISELCHAMPRSGRGNALKQWITKHVAVKWNAKAHGGKGGYVKKEHSAEKQAIMSSWHKVAIIMQAMKEPFYLKEDKEASVWNEQGAIVSLVKRLAKKAEEETLSAEGVALLEAYKAVS